MPSPNRNRTNENLFLSDQNNFQLLINLLRAPDILSLGNTSGLPETQLSGEILNNKSARKAINQNILNIKESLAEINPDAILFDGLDEALIGISDVSFLAVYEKNIIVKILEERDGMQNEEALEYYEYNIAGVRAENAPIIIDIGFFLEAIQKSNKKTQKTKKRKNFKKPNKQEFFSSNPIDQLEL